MATQWRVSMAKVLRELVDAHLMDSPGGDRHDRAMRAVGRHRSSREDVSHEHDRELADPFTR